MSHTKGWEAKKKRAPWHANLEWGKQSHQLQIPRLKNWDEERIQKLSFLFQSESPSSSSTWLYRIRLWKIRKPKFQAESNNNSVKMKSKFHKWWPLWASTSWISSDQSFKMKGKVSWFVQSNFPIKKSWNYDRVVPVWNDSGYENAAQKSKKRDLLSPFLFLGIVTNEVKFLELLAQSKQDYFFWRATRNCLSYVLE